MLLQALFLYAEPSLPSAGYATELTSTGLFGKIATIDMESSREVTQRLLVPGEVLILSSSTASPGGSLLLTTNPDSNYGINQFIDIYSADGRIQKEYIQLQNCILLICKQGENITFAVPASYSGDYYFSVYNYETQDFEQYAFTVVPVLFSGFDEAQTAQAPSASEYQSGAPFWSNDSILRQPIPNWWNQTLVAKDPNSGLMIQTLIDELVNAGNPNHYLALSYYDSIPMHRYATKTNYTLMNVSCQPSAGATPPCPPPACESWHEFNRIVAPISPYKTAINIPIPNDAWLSSSVDPSMCFVYYDTYEAYCLFEAQFCNGQYYASSVDKLDIREYGHRAGPIRGVGGSAISGVQMMVRPEEVLSGEIQHPLRVIVPGARNGYFVLPANLDDGEVDWNVSINGTLVFPMPEGARLQLKPTINVSNPTYNLSPNGQTIARALQMYGAIIVDEGGGFNADLINVDENRTGLWYQLLQPPAGSFSTGHILSPFKLETDWQVIVVPPLRSRNNYTYDNDLDGWKSVDALGVETDCNDSNINIYPGRVEVCDGIDNNCKNGIDDGCSVSSSIVKLGSYTVTPSADDLEIQSIADDYVNNKKVELVIIEDSSTSTDGRRKAKALQSAAQRNNKTIKLLLYKNWQGTVQGSTASDLRTGLYGELYVQNTLGKSYWFLDEPNRHYWTSGVNYVVMDPRVNNNGTNQGWPVQWATVGQQRTINLPLPQGGTVSFDGLFGDDLWHSGTVKTGGVWPTGWDKYIWETEVRSALVKMGNISSTLSQELWFNLGSGHKDQDKTASAGTSIILEPTYWTSRGYDGMWEYWISQPGVSGFMEEGFAQNIDKKWRRDLERMKFSESIGKGYFANWWRDRNNIPALDTEDKQIMFSFASYLLAANGSSYYEYGDNVDDPSHRLYEFREIFNVGDDLGMPLDAFRCYDGNHVETTASEPRYCKRLFTNGMVIVNAYRFPNATTGTPTGIINLGGNYSSMDVNGNLGPLITSINVSGISQAILVKSAGGSNCTDLDGDGYGNPGSASCTYPQTDCNDNVATINPGRAEICTDGIDNNCNGEADYDNSSGFHGDSACPVGVMSLLIPTPVPESTYFIMNCTSTVTGVNSIATYFDRNDNLVADGTEECPFVGWSGMNAQFNCSSGTYNLVTSGLRYGQCNVDTAKSYNSTGRVLNTTTILDIACTDADGDGYGVCPNCNTTNGCTFNGNDCSDTNASVNPGQTTDGCDGIDTDCNGTVDDGALFDTCQQKCQAFGYSWNASRPGASYDCCGDDSGSPTYEDTPYQSGEAMCDTRDNDCDTLIDEPLFGSPQPVCNACTTGGSLSNHISLWYANSISAMDLMQSMGDTYQCGG